MALCCMCYLNELRTLFFSYFYIVVVAVVVAPGMHLSGSCEVCTMVLYVVFSFSDFSTIVTKVLMNKLFEMYALWRHLLSFIHRT